MKYRYDREIDLAHRCVVINMSLHYHNYNDRSCIKKILEHDDNSMKSMVLVITEICSCDDVTDGSCDQTDVKVLSLSSY